MTGVGVAVGLNTVGVGVVGGRGLGCHSGVGMILSVSGM